MDDASEKVYEAGNGRLVVLVDDGLPDIGLWDVWLQEAFAVVAKQVPAYAKARAWEVVVRLSDNDTVRVLNNDFRGFDKPTNVLSFPNNDDGLDDVWSVGDLVLAVPVVRAEANSLARPLANHVRHLAVHGLLHLVGYDHMNADDAATMERLEAQLLAMMGVPSPYDEGDM